MTTAASLTMIRSKVGVLVLLLSFPLLCFHLDLLVEAKSSSSSSCIVRVPSSCTTTSKLPSCFAYYIPSVPYTVGARSHHRHSSHQNTPNLYGDGCSMPKEPQQPPQDDARWWSLVSQKFWWRSRNNQKNKQGLCMENLQQRQQNHDLGYQSPPNPVDQMSSSSLSTSTSKRRKMATAATLFATALIPRLPKVTTTTATATATTSTPFLLLNSLHLERIGKSLLVIAAGYIMARWKRHFLLRWTSSSTTAAAAASNDDDYEEPAHHFHFYNFIGNGIVGAVSAWLFLKIFPFPPAVHTGIQSLFAAGGVGALVFGIAARQVADQLMGGIVLAAHDVYEEGDRIKLPESANQLEGTVKRFRFLETHIETPDYNVVRIPNSRLVKQHVINISRIRQCRIQETVRIRYSDISKIPALTETIIPQAIVDTGAPLFKNNPTTAIRAFVSSFQKDHIELVINCHLNCRPGSAAFLHWRQEILLAIANGIHAGGAEFSLPTSILSPPPSQLQRPRINGTTNATNRQLLDGKHSPTKNPVSNTQMSKPHGDNHPMNEKVDGDSASF